MVYVYNMPAEVAELRDYRFVRKAFIRHLEKRNRAGSVLQQ